MILGQQYACKYVLTSRSSCQHVSLKSQKTNGETNYAAAFRLQIIALKQTSHQGYWSFLSKCLWGLQQAWAARFIRATSQAANWIIYSSSTESLTCLWFLMTANEAEYSVLTLPCCKIRITQSPWTHPFSKNCTQPLSHEFGEQKKKKTDVLFCLSVIC